MRRVAIPLTIILVVAGVAIATPAHADETLAAAFAAGGELQLTTSVNEPTTVLTLVDDGALVLDLAGHDLAVQSIVLGEGSSLRITVSTEDPGTLTADSRAAVAPTNRFCADTLNPPAQSPAAIQTTDAALTIDGTANVVARAGIASAGIGSGNQEFVSAGTLVIGGSANVTASAQSYGSGIGGGCFGDAGSITITDNATVNATGGRVASAIGAGYGSADDEILITGNATVVADCPSIGCSGIGASPSGLLGDLTISGNANVTATGNGGSAIGNAGFSGTSTVLITDNATVVAKQGKYSGIGIGSHGGSIVHITGNASVTSFGGQTDPAIGGGSSKIPSTVIIDGSARVDVTAGSRGPGLGGRTSTSQFGAITIGADARVTAKSSTTGAAVGSEYLGTYHPPGSLKIDGELILPDNSWMQIPAALTVTGTGKISGAGRIDNLGAIALPDANVTATVTGNNFRVAYVTPAGTETPPAERVLATSFDALGRSLPVVERPPAYSQRAWLKGKKAFTSATPLTGNVALVAQWIPYAESLALPVVSGTTNVGHTLAAATTSWPSDTVVSYKWQRNGKTIAGATGSAYTLVGSDHGSHIRAVATGVRAGYATATRYSVQTPTIAIGALASGATSILGTNTVGSTLSLDTNGWMPQPTFGYQWYSNGVAVKGATKPTFVVKTAGSYMSVVVTARSRGYSTVKTLAAIESTDELAGFTTQPVPTVTGVVQTGKTLRANAGVWAPRAKLTYQWLSDGVAIVGATAPTYKIPAGRRAAQLSVAVTASRSGYVSVRSESAATVPVLGTITGVPKTVYVFGLAKVGYTRDVSTYKWPDDVTLSYQWFRQRGNSTQTLAGQTRGYYTLTATDKGTKVYAQVTASKPGYASVTRSSPVKAAPKVAG